MMIYQFTQNVPEAIFRAYDIRGIVDEQISEAAVYSMGQVLAAQSQALGQNAWVVGRDGRLSGRVLLEALAQGLLDGGCDVTMVGCVPTPALYFATHTLAANCGVMLTGSHNPVQYNGLKIILNGQTLSGQGINQIYQDLQGHLLSSLFGQRTNHDILPAYQAAIVNSVSLKRPLKVVVDCGNGAMGVIAPQVLKALGCELTELYSEVDGSFPNHHPDPSKLENLTDLIATVQETGSDIGLAFDGDGDRLGMVSNSGQVIFPDRQMMLFSEAILKERPGAQILFDVKCSKQLADHITACKGEPVMCKTGHSFVKAELLKTGAPLAGEMSGHLFFNDRWFGFDDGLYAAARLLEIISQSPNTVDEQFAPLTKGWCTPEIQVAIIETEKFNLVQQFIEHSDFPGSEKITIDGLRVNFPDGWGLLRASNTTPCLVLRFEGDDEAALLRIQAQFRQQLLAVSPHLEVGF